MSQIDAPAPPLRALELPWLMGAIHNGALHELRRTNPGPFHLVHPGTFAATIDRWIAAGREAGIPLAVRFGKKANKSPSLARQCARLSAEGHDVGVDVASAEEFTAALAAGNRGDRLVVTGPTHPQPLVNLAAKHHATLTVSTSSDLERASRLAQGSPLNVLIRLRTEAGSRFGLEASEWGEFLRERRGHDHGPRIRGVSFHCSGYTIAERITATQSALDLARVAQEAGHPVDTICAGGGWPVNYLHSDSSTHPSIVWSTYREALSSRNFFMGSMPQASYPYGLEPSGHVALAEFLRSATVSELRRRGLRLMVEPGRALCTGAGASAFPVLSTQDRPERGPRLGISVVDGTSLSVSEQWFASEFFPDPLLLDANSRYVTSDGPAYGAAIAGRTCLDGDLLSRRYVPVPRRPREGDLIIYPDTAGYQMDSNESTFHDIPLPEKYVVEGLLDDPWIKEDT